MLRCSEDENAFFPIDKLNAKYKNPMLCDMAILRIKIYLSKTIIHCSLPIPKNYKLAPVHMQLYVV